jgi:hypothetical protein
MRAALPAMLEVLLDRVHCVVGLLNLQLVGATLGGVDVRVAFTYIESGRGLTYGKANN